MKVGKVVVNRSSFYSHFYKLPDTAELRYFLFIPLCNSTGWLCFYILIIWEGIGFMWKITFPIFIKSQRVETREWEKTDFTPASVCKYGNFWINYRIGLRVGPLFYITKREDEFVNLPFLTNGSGFIHQKRFLQNQKIHFPAKLCEIRINVNKKKCWP